MGRNPALPPPPPTDGPAKLREGIGSLESCPMMVTVVQFPDSGKRMLMKTKMHSCKEKWKTCLRINMVFSVITQRIVPSAHWLRRGRGDRERWEACLFCHSGWVRLFLISKFCDRRRETNLSIQITLWNNKTKVKWATINCTKVPRIQPSSVYRRNYFINSVCHYYTKAMSSSSQVTSILNNFGDYYYCITR